MDKHILGWNIVAIYIKLILYTVNNMYACLIMCRRLGPFELIVKM